MNIKTDNSAILFHVVGDNDSRLSHLAPGLTDADILSLFSAMMPLGVWRLELETGHEYWNDALFEMMGLTPRREPINFTEYSRRFHPDDLLLRLQLLEHAASNKVGYHYRLRMKLKDDSYSYICCVAAFKAGPAGRDELYGIFFMAPDASQPA